MRLIRRIITVVFGSSKPPRDEFIGPLTWGAQLDRELSRHL